MPKEHKGQCVWGTSQTFVLAGGWGHKCLFLRLTISQHLSFSPCPSLSWHLSVLPASAGLLMGWEALSGQGHIPLHGPRFWGLPGSFPYTGGTKRWCPGAVTPHNHGSVLPTELHSCGQWKQLFMGIEHLLALLFSTTPSPFLGQKTNVPVTQKVRPRKPARFWSACLGNLSWLLGSWGLEGLLPNGLFPSSQMVYLRQKVEQKAFSYETLWEDVQNKWCLVLGNVQLFKGLETQKFFCGNRGLGWSRER